MIIDRDLVEFRRRENFNDLTVSIAMRYPHNGGWIYLDRLLCQEEMSLFRGNMYLLKKQEMIDELDKWLVEPILDWERAGNLTP